MPSRDPVIPFVTLKLPDITVDPVWKMDPVNVIVSALEKNTVPVLPETLIEPVTPNDPVIRAEPVYGNADIPPLIKEAVTAFCAQLEVP